MLLFFVLTVFCNTSSFAEMERMTYKEAVSRIPDRELPKFWVGDETSLPGSFSELSKGEVRVITVTPGGRPLYLVSYGTREGGSGEANFNSAIGGRLPSAYMDKASRKRPVILFVGPVHGQEVEALTGLVNLIQVMEAGRDLRGRNQAQLKKLGDRCRLLIVPSGNPDGIARFEPRTLNDMSVDDLRFWGQGTWSDETFCDWPEVKRVHPMIGPRVGFLGCYFNDDGINPMHDEFFRPMGPEAPAILKLAREEGPDLAVSLHSHGAKPALLRPAFITLDGQNKIRELSKQYYRLLKKNNLPYGQVFEARPEMGNPPPSFNLTSAIYHVSGAFSFTFECPHGLSDDSACRVNLEQILDIQLLLYEAMMEFALNQK
jgi:hypothetical protein